MTDGSPVPMMWMRFRRSAAIMHRRSMEDLLSCGGRFKTDEMSFQHSQAAGRLLRGLARICAGHATSIRKSV
jgi:hypothetical protein